MGGIFLISFRLDIQKIFNHLNGRLIKLYYFYLPIIIIMNFIDNYKWMSRVSIFNDSKLKILKEKSIIIGLEIWFILKVTKTLLCFSN